MNKRTLVRTLALCALANVAVSARAQDALQRGFQNPPASARPHTWWHWMNGNVSKEGITLDLEAMAKAGIGGAQIFNVDQGIPAGKVPYMSPQWIEAMVHAASEAKRLKLELCFHNCAGWSSSGGPWIDQAHAMQKLTWSETNVSGGKNVAVTLLEPAKQGGYYNDVCVLAIKKSATSGAGALPDLRAKAYFDRGSGIGTDPLRQGIPQGDIVVLSCKPDGSVSWDAPAGDWTLVRLGHTLTGAVNAPAPEAGRGLECDKLSREAIDMHWEKGIAPVLKAMGPQLTGKALNNSLIDSYEMGAQNWTPALRSEFQKRRGYNPLPWLAVVTGRVVGTSEQSERFLWDFRRTIDDLFAENYTGRFKELCHQNGMLFSVEPYGNGTFDNLQIGVQADIPMGEFWMGGAAAETIKIAASSAHITGRSIVGAESFTTDESHGRWLVEPYTTKTIGDRMFADGLNRYIFHRYAHQPWTDLKPGMTMGPWGTHLERTLTWWDQSHEWFRYIARCQYLLQSGSFVADVLTYAGDDTPSDMLRPALPPGFDYDGCDRGVLMGARVDKGQIVLPSGARYRVLILPDSDWMLPATLEKIDALVRAGATVVGRAPKHSPSLVGYPASENQIASLAATVKLTPPSQLARVLGTPDVLLSDKRGRNGFPWIHRKSGNTDYYFVSNGRYDNQSVTASFRVSGRTPELWHPETGKLEAAPVWKQVGNRTEVTLDFAPAESVFVVFRKPATDNHLVQIMHSGGPVVNTRQPVLTIESAFYEATDGAGGANVTEKVRQLVQQGQTDIAVANETFGDPTRDHVKRFRIVYYVDGKRQDRILSENETLSLLNTIDIRLPDYLVQNNRLLAFSPGSYTLLPAVGLSRQVTVAAPQVQPFTGPWNVAFPPNLGAPASITLDRLLPLSEHATPGVKYFSGTATYTTTFTVAPSMTGKNKAVWLDLGRVKNFAEITVNGKALPTLWKAPWRVDVTDLVRSGTNSLQVRITNLWPNRLVGDEQLPPEVDWAGPTGPMRAWPQWLIDGKSRPQTDRVTFTTWRFWTKNDVPPESGLIGPVVLRSVSTVPLDTK